MENKQHQVKQEITAKHLKTLEDLYNTLDIKKQGLEYDLDELLLELQ